MMGRYNRFNILIGASLLAAACTIDDNSPVDVPEDAAPEDALDAAPDAQSLPSAPIIDTPYGDSLVTTTTPTVSGYCQAGSTVAILPAESSSDPLCETACDDDGKFSCAISAALAEGPASIWAQATNEAGSATSFARAFTVDSIAPTVTIDVPAADETFLTTTIPTVSGTCTEALSLVTVYSSAAAEPICAAICLLGSYECQVSDQARLVWGDHELTAEQYDAAGNQEISDVRALEVVQPVQLAIGGEHTCALFSNGRVKCWGANGRGQLGLGDSEVRGYTPSDMGSNLPLVNVGGLATQIRAGSLHTCALLESGAVKCWGDNFYGQLGLGDTNNRGNEPGEMGSNLPVVDVGGVVTKIAAGANHTCALLVDGTAKCWGENGSGRLGLGDTNSRGDGPGEMGSNLPAVNVGGVATHLTASQSHTCALLVGGTVKCWGENNSGRLGLGDTITRGDGPNEMGANLPAVNLGGVATHIAAGQAYTCALLDGGTAKCWGYNSEGQLGLGDTNSRGDGPNEMGNNLPAVSTGGVATQLTAGVSHTCALLEGGTTKCWGNNSYRQLGLGDTNNRGDGPNEMGVNLPVVDIGGLVAEITTGANGNHTCAVLANGFVKCFGQNQSGKLGLGLSYYEMGVNLPIIEL